MTDPRQEDQERDTPAVVLANRVGECAAEVCKDKILVGQPIVQVDGSWVHDDGSCRDDFEAQLAERDRLRGYTPEQGLGAMEVEAELEGDDRPWRACVPDTILQDDLTEERAREVAARDEANRPDDAIGHAYVEQYDPPKVCPTCGVIEGTGETL